MRLGGGHLMNEYRQIEEFPGMISDLQLSVVGQMRRQKRVLRNSSP